MHKHINTKYNLFLWGINVR